MNVSGIVRKVDAAVVLYREVLVRHDMGEEAWVARVTFTATHIPDLSIMTFVMEAAGREIGSHPVIVKYCLGKLPQEQSWKARKEFRTPPNLTEAVIKDMEIGEAVILAVDRFRAWFAEVEACVNNHIAEMRNEMAIVQIMEL